MTSPVSRRSVLGSLAAASIAGIAPATARSRRFDLEYFVSEVRAANKESDALHAVEEVLTRELADPSSVLQALGEPTSVGLTPIYRANDLTVLNIVLASVCGDPYVNIYFLLFAKCLRKVFCDTGIGRIDDKLLACINSPHIGNQNLVIPTVLTN